MSAFAPSRDVRGCVDQGSAEDAEEDAAARVLTDNDTAVSDAVYTVTG